MYSLPFTGSSWTNTRPDRFISEPQYFGAQANLSNGWLVGILPTTYMDTLSLRKDAQEYMPLELAG